MGFVRRHIWLTLACLGVLGGLAWSFMPQAIEVDAARVARGSLEVTVDHEGKTRTKDRYVVSAPLSGQLLRIALKPGAPVRPAETTLAILEPTDPALLDARSRAEAEARVKVSEAAVQQARARGGQAKEAHELTRRNLERVRGALAGNAVSREDMDTAGQRERIAREEMRAAQSAEMLASFELELSRAAFVRTRLRSSGEPAQEQFKITSPISGVVLRVFQESAATVAAGTRLLEIGDPADVEVEVDVLSADAVKIRPGAKVRLEHWGGGDPLEGRVRLVEPAGFTKISALGVEEQRVWVIIDLLTPLEQRRALGDAYRVEARIVVWEAQNILKLPAGALFRSDGEWAVFVLRDGQARLERIKIGQNNGLEAEVLSGLVDGDTVILHPGDRVHEGSRVKPRGATAQNAER